MSGLGLKEIMETINSNVASQLGLIWSKNAHQNMYNFKNFKKLRNLIFEPQKIAVVCGAGPSLSDPAHLEFLKKYRNHLAIFAADTAFPVLYKNEIYPDFTVTIDPESVAGCFAFKQPPLSCKLLACNVTNPASIQAWPNKEIYVFNLSSTLQVAHELTLLMPNLDPVESRLNVGEFCINLAVQYFNYKVVIFTGLDFAYVGEKDYADGVEHSISHEADEYVMLDCENKPVRVSPSFIGFTIAFMANYRLHYSKKAALISLNRGMLPFKYDYGKAVTLLESMKIASEK